jgi:hypothetical protein
MWQRFLVGGTKFAWAWAWAWFFGVGTAVTAYVTMIHAHFWYFHKQKNRNLGNPVVTVAQPRSDSWFFLYYSIVTASKSAALNWVPKVLSTISNHSQLNSIECMHVVLTTQRECCRGARDSRESGFELCIMITYLHSWRYCVIALYHNIKVFALNIVKRHCQYTNFPLCNFDAWMKVQPRFQPIWYFLEKIAHCKWTRTQVTKP